MKAAEDPAHCCFDSTQEGVLNQMRPRIIRTCSTMLSLLLLVAVPTQASPLKFVDVINVMGDLQNGGQLQRIRLRAVLPGARPFRIPLLKQARKTRRPLSLRRRRLIRNCRDRQSPRALTVLLLRSSREPKLPHNGPRVMCRSLSRTALMEASATAARFRRSVVASQNGLSWL